MAASALGTASTTPAFSRFMLLSMKACGLPRYSDTSIWSSETPCRCVRAAIFDSESPGLTLYSSAPVGAATSAGLAAGRGSREAAASARGVAGAGTGRPAEAARGGTGAADDIVGAVVAAGAGAGARAVAGGSNSIVYSRTNRPVDQLTSRITSTKGSCTPRLLVSLR